MKQNPIKTIEETGGRHRCKKHFNRYAWSSRGGVDYCYICLYGRKTSDYMLGPSYYEEDGPGYAGPPTS